MRIAVCIFIGLFVSSVQSAPLAQQRGDGDWLLQEKATLNAAGVGPNMRFGHSISISGDAALIGAPNCLNQCPPAQPGRAFFFERDAVGGEWNMAAALIASEGAPSDEFGSSVLLDGDTALIGAMRANIQGNNQQGAVYVFERDSVSGEWEEQTRLLASDGEALHRFGFSLALSGDTLLVGANGVTVGDNFSQGAVYVFERDEISGDWIEQTRLTADDGASFDGFGEDLALDGRHALIAAPTASVDGNFNQGKAYIFERDEISGDWVQRDILSPAEGFTQSHFSESVALAGGLALIGAPGTPINGDSERGAVHVFALDSDEWQEVQRFEAPDGSRFHRFGSSVSVDGERALVGADGVFADGHARRGAVYRWQRDGGGEWTFLDRFGASELSAEDLFGATVRQAGGYVLVGAPGTEVNNLEGQGAAYVFEPPEPGLFVSPAAIDFDPVPAGGGSLTRTVTLYNTGGDPVEISQLAEPSPLFPITQDGCGPAPFNLPAGGQCTVALAFQPASVEPAAAVLEIHSDAPGSPHSITLSGDGVSHGLQFKLVAADGEQGDQFHVLATEGDLTVVGAPSAQDHGAAYVFERDALDGSWQERAKLVPEDGAFGDNFGSSVALNEGRILVGASGTEIDGVNHGVVFMFEQDTNGDWQQQAEVLPDELGQAGFGGVRFGESMAVAGDRLLVGASGEEAAYLFERDGSGQWTDQQRLTAAGETFGFGVSVALEGDTLFVGASGTNVDGNPLQGTVHVFERDSVSGDWIEQPRLVGSGGQNLDRFGYRVALDGDRALIGSPATLNADRAGRVHVYERDVGSGDWMERAVLAAGGINDLFGSSVVLSGDTAVVGAPRQHAGGHWESGTAYVFERSADDDQWHQQFALEAFDGRQADEFGTTLAMSGDTLMVGAIASMDGYSNRGAVYVFGTPASASGLYSAPDPLVFSAVAAGETDGPRSVALINADPHPVTVTDIEKAASPFFAEGGGCGPVPFDLGPGMACTLTYTFTPPETGGFTDTVEVASTASSSPDLFGLQSEGLERELQVMPGSLDFGTVAVGASGAPLSVELSNTGELDVIIQPVQAPGGPFAVAGDSCGATNVVPSVLPPGETCVVDYTFNPVAVGDFQAGIDIVTNAPSSPDAVLLEGTGGGAILEAAPTSLDATVHQGQVETLPLELANPGNETLDWSVTEAPGRSVLRVSGEVTRQATRGGRPAAGGFIAQPDAGPWRRVTPAPSGSGDGLTLTHSASMDIVDGNSVACAGPTGSSQASYLRTFTLSDFGIATDFEVDEVAFGIQSLTAEASISVNLYTLEGEFVYANMELIGTATQTLDPQTLTLVTVPVTGTVPPGGMLVVEVEAPDLQPQQAAFFVGSNDLGETGDSYAVAPNCDTHEPTPFSTLGAPHVHVVMSVSGRSSDCEHPAWLEVSPQSGSVAAGGSQTVEVTFNPKTTDLGAHTGTLCLASNDPVTPLTLVPLTLTVTEPPEPAPPMTRLAGSDGASNDWFGRSVSLDDDTLVVSADAADIDGITNQGAAYVFVYEDGDWAEQAKLVADDGAQFDQFGFSVSIDGDTALIGSSAGAAYVFGRNEGVWTQQARLAPSDGHADDGFGLAVSLDGDTALVGAREHDTDGNTNQGAAYVFVRSGDEWVEQAKLTAGDGVWFDLFGISTALSGDTALVGAAFHDTGGNENQGAVYVFTREGGDWTEQAKLFDPAGAASDWFGNAIALDGDTAVISADQRNASGQGKAYVYTRRDGVWEEPDVLAAADGAGGDIFGESVAVQGENALVGALFADQARGAAYLYTREEDTWSQQTRFWVEDAAPDDQFGKSADIDGTWAAIGAWTENEGQGAVYVTDLGIEPPLEPGVLEVEPADVTFSKVPVDDTRTSVVTVSNAGEPGVNEPLEIESIGLDGDPAFVVTGGSCEAGAMLDPGASCTVEVAFGPVEPGTVAGILEIRTTDEQLAVVDLSGEGIKIPPVENRIFEDRFQPAGVP